MTATIGLSGGASALSIALVVLAFAVLVIWARFDRDRGYDDELHHNRLLDELRKQPHTERDEY